MSRIEDIERMSLEELEERSSVCPPASEELKSDLELSLALCCEAQRIKESRNKRKRSFVIAAPLCAAFALGLAAFLVLWQGSPKDSFSRPEDAYAALQQTLDYMGSKMDKGLSLVKDGESKISKPVDIMESIMNKK